MFTLGKVYKLWPGEICIRAGGDEFYLLGVGKYTGEDLKQRREMFEAYVEQADKSSGKPYPVSASMGCAMIQTHKGIQVNNVLNMADVEMYKNKIERKKQRI